MASSFTQLIWKDTAKFGIAKSSAEKDGKHMVFIVAIYRSPGNVHGLYEKNILKGRFIKTYCDKTKAKQHVHKQETHIITTTALKSLLQKKHHSGKNVTSSEYIIFFVIYTNKTECPNTFVLYNPSSPACHRLLLWVTGVNFDNKLCGLGAENLKGRFWGH